MAGLTRNDETLRMAFRQRIAEQGEQIKHLEEEIARQKEANQRLCAKIDEQSAYIATLETELVVHITDTVVDVPSIEPEVEKPKRPRRKKTDAEAEETTE